MNFNILLGLSIIVCLVGLFIRFSIWFSQALPPAAQTISPMQRLTTGIQAVFSTLFSTKIFLALKSTLLDLFLQKRIFDKSTLRWTAHTLIFTGFILLFFMHALGSVVSDSLFSDYQPTLNPFLFLRNLFGIMVLVGIGLAIYRRISQKSQRLKSSTSDWAALIFISVIILSGMLLEGSKMSSITTFQGMIDEYADLDDTEINALEAYWVLENGLRSPNIVKPVDPALVAEGMEVNSDSCMDCHAPNSSAFASKTLSPLTVPFSSALGDAATVSFFWYLHILACLSFLAWIPFSKMFHILAAPVSLIIKSVTGDTELENPASILNRQMIGLSACTHCGSCSVECSSSMFYESFQNDFILPSEKVQYLKKIAAGKENNPEVLKQMQQGLYVCTSCDRCTTVCPSGINLKEIFVSARYALLAKGTPETSMLSHFSFPLALAKNFVDDHIKALKKVTDIFKQSFPHLADIDAPVTLNNTQKFDNSSFNGCFSCQRCTNICPVVRSYDNPGEALGMLPHQIMFSLGIGNIDLATGAQMIWSCSTCYLCQEHCPNQVELCDIFYSLKNRAISKIEAGANS